MEILPSDPNKLLAILTLTRTLYRRATQEIAESNTLGGQPVTQRDMQVLNRARQEIADAEIVSETTHPTR